MSDPRSVSPPRISFNRVLSLLDDMRGAESLDAMADSWELFLIYHHRTWNRCEKYYPVYPFWGQLHAKYKYLRKRDPLLQYVHQARNADEHGLALVAVTRPAFAVVSGGTLMPGSVITGDGQSVLALGSTARVVFHPASVVANPVMNRGEVYQPPVMDGQEQPPVLLLAEAAVDFYRRLFMEVDSHGGD